MNEPHNKCKWYVAQKRGVWCAMKHEYIKETDPVCKHYEKFKTEVKYLGLHGGGGNQIVLVHLKVNDKYSSSVAFNPDEHFLSDEDNRKMLIDLKIGGAI